MRATAMFEGAPATAGMYESFYLRAVAPDEPVGVWLRYTVHKRPGEAPSGSLWCTVFDVTRGAPFMHKTTSLNPTVPAGTWIEIDGQARIGPQGAAGSCGPVSWSLDFSAAVTELRHLRPSWLYRAPLPRTKLTSPAPLALMHGTVELPGRTLELDGWPGMVGHNWGREHAERWIWIHGCAFVEDGTAWIDLAAGRLAMAGRLTPWVANGMLCAGGHASRLGGILSSRPTVSETPQGCELSVAAGRHQTVHILATVPAGSAAGWSYADPNGGRHDVVNCSVSGLRVERTDQRGGAESVLHTQHGGVYELGMRERDHGVPIAPFSDGWFPDG